MTSKILGRFLWAALALLFIVSGPVPVFAQRGLLGGGRLQAERGQRNKNARGDDDPNNSPDRNRLLGGNRRRNARDRDRDRDNAETKTPVAPPLAATPAAPGRRVYDPADPLRRVYIQETHQYTGESVTEAGGLITTPAPATAPTAAPGPAVNLAPVAEAPVAATPPTEAAVYPAPPPPEPLTPPANTVITRIEPAKKADRDLLVDEIEARLDAILKTDLEETLRPALWSENDRDRARELGRAKGMSGEALASFERTLAVDAPVAGPATFEAARLAPVDYEPLVKRIALRKALSALKSQRPDDAAAMDEAVRRLAGAAVLAGLAEETLRPVGQQLVALTHLRDRLRGVDGKPFDSAIELGNVLPDTLFTVVYSTSYPGPPVALDAETLLTTTPPSDPLRVRESTAARLGLPILGSNEPAVAAPGAEPPGRGTGLTFSTPAGSGADLTLWVLDPNGTTFTRFVVSPGGARTIPDRPSAQVCYLDGASADPTPWRDLAAGSFEFRREAGVWRLTPLTFPITLDNTANAQPFRYRIDGHEGTIPARRAVTMNRTDLRTTIEFDRGNHQVSSRLLQSGPDRYAVRLDAESQGLDLYRFSGPPPALDAGTAVADTDRDATRDRPRAR